MIVPLSPTAMPLSFDERKMLLRLLLFAGEVTEFQGAAAGLRDHIWPPAPTAQMRLFFPSKLVIARAPGGFPFESLSAPQSPMTALAIETLSPTASAWYRSSVLIAS